MVSRQRAFFLLSVLSRALSHQVRTPLSVISNDLFYFKSQLPEGECEKTAEKCREISDRLSLASKLRWPLKEEVYNAEVVISEVFAESSCEKLPNEWRALKGDREYLKWAFTTLKTLGFSKINCSHSGVRLSGEIISDNPGELSSFSEVLNIKRGSDSIEAPLIDAIFWAHAIQTTVKDRGAELTIGEKQD